MVSIAKALHQSRLLVTAFLILGIYQLCADPPRHVYLTWEGDTSRQITVNFQTLEKVESPEIRYDTRSRAGDPAKYAMKASSPERTHQIPDIVSPPRWIHWVQLSNLKPGATYYFIAGDKKAGFSPEMKFKTISAGDEPLRFIDGGDMGVGSTVPTLLKLAAGYEPNWFQVGGDITYGKIPDSGPWDTWLDHLRDNLVTPQGFTVPLVLAIGNHEVQGGYKKQPDDARIFYKFFAQAETGYYSRTFGKNLVLLVLDSDHTSAVDGDQKTWLEKTLGQYKDVPFRFATYHVPLYPSVRPFTYPNSADLRTHWMPIFDKYKLTAGFEHHDHAYKRSKLLRNGVEDPQGTLYLGDGCMGQPALLKNLAPRPYEAFVKGAQYFMVVDVTKTSAKYRAIDIEGKAFDTYPAEK